MRPTFGAAAPDVLAPMVFGCPAQAQPAGFPDLIKLTTISPELHIERWSKGAADMSVLAFATTHDIGCISVAQKELSDSTQGIRCGGAPVGVNNILTTDLIKREVATPKPSDCVVSAVEPGGDSTGVMCQLSHYFYGRCGDKSLRPTDSGSLLGVGQKTSCGHVTCAVDANRAVACLDTFSGEHGLVLKPSDSWIF